MISNKERYFRCRTIYESLESASDAERVDLLKEFQTHISFFKEHNLQTEHLENLLKETENDIIDPKALLNSINQHLSTYEGKVVQFKDGKYIISKNLLGDTFGFEELINVRNTVQWYLKRARRAGISLKHVEPRLQKADAILKQHTQEKRFSFFQTMAMRWKGVNPVKDERWWFYREERA